MIAPACLWMFPVVSFVLYFVVVVVVVICLCVFVVVIVFTLFGVCL